MKILFVGDLHGEVDWHAKAVKYCKENNALAVFVGDYVDSFDNGIKKQMQLLENIADDRSGNIYLIGNHDMSYMSQGHRCSGYKENYANEFRKRLLQIFYRASTRWWFDFPLADGRILFASHAGFSVNLSKKYRYFSIEQISYAMLRAELTARLHPYDEQTKREVVFEGRENNGGYDLLSCGPARGTRAGVNRDVGGLTWARPMEDMLNHPSVVQVCGHTNTNAIRDRMSLTKEIQSAITVENDKVGMVYIPNSTNSGVWYIDNPYLKEMLLVDTEANTFEKIIL